MKISSCFVSVATLLYQLLVSSIAFSELRDFECREGSPPIAAQEADAIATKVQESYKKIETLQANFSQDSYLAALDTSELSSGTVSYKRPALMRWDYREPEAQTFLLQDKEFKLYQPHDHQLIVDKLSKVLLSDLPVAFLFGLGDLKRDFKVKGACQTNSGVVLTLQTSSDKAGDLSSVDLLVDAKAGIPHGARIHDVGGNINSILFKALITNVNFPKDKFKLEVEKGTDVIDRVSIKE